ncbi:MAG: hypothetical protein WAM85_18735 [Terracidiphilus sp.]
MRKTTIICCLLFLTSALGMKAFGQVVPDIPKTTEPVEHYYRLDFVVQEVGVDGKPTNSRSYSTIVSTGRTDPFGTIRTGSRVPVMTGAVPGSTGSDKLEVQYQYVDVGVSIDTRNAHEIGHQLALHVSADVSSLADSTSSSTPASSSNPVIRQNTWQASVLIPIGKPTVIFTSDSLDSKGSMQVVVTATPLQ